MTSKKIRAHSASWDVKKSRLQVRFPRLTDADLNFDQMREKEMLGKLEFKLAMTIEELLIIMEAP